MIAMKQRLGAVLLTLSLLLPPYLPAAGQDETLPQALTDEEAEIVAMLELLELMDLLQNLEVLTIMEDKK
jgi:hypothetical protein